MPTDVFRERCTAQGMAKSAGTSTNMRPEIGKCDLEFALGDKLADFAHRGIF
jgi:hypothetical protein